MVTIDYHKYYVKLAEYEIGKTFNKNNTQSAAGLDGWSAQDIAPLSDLALDDTDNPVK